MTEKITKIGVGLIIIKDDKVLMSRRKNAHGSGTYAGHDNGDWCHVTAGQVLD